MKGVVINGNKDFDLQMVLKSSIKANCSLQLIQEFITKVIQDNITFPCRLGRIDVSMSYREDKWTWLTITQEWGVNTKQGSRVNQENDMWMNHPQVASANHIT